MKQNSEDEPALIKIQREWAEARVKGDSSYTHRLETEDFTVVWFDGRIVNKQEDMKSMTGDTVVADLEVDDLQVRFDGDTGIVVGQASIKAHTKSQDLSGNYVWTDTFVKHNGEWKAGASDV